LRIERGKIGVSYWIGGIVLLNFASISCHENSGLRQESEMKTNWAKKEREEVPMLTSSAILLKKIVYLNCLSFEENVSSVFKRKDQ
jgi:hypothetical protein